MNIVPIYSARGVLDAIAKVLGCATKDVENELERIFEVEIRSEYQSEARLDAIRDVPIFYPGEGQDIINHIHALVKNSGQEKPLASP